MLAFLTNSSEKGVEVQRNNRIIGLILGDGFCSLYSKTTFSPDELKEIARKTEEHLAEIEFQVKSQKPTKGAEDGH